MEHTNSKSKPVHFAICYGFMEGPGHSRSLRKQLQTAGFVKTNLHVADIIIAHSAGCVLLPADATPKLVIYTGMPLVLARPQHTWVHASWPHLKNGQWKHELRNRSNNTYYGLRNLKRNVSIMRDPKIAQPVIFPKAQAVFIANRHDPWPKGPELDKLVESHPWAFISLPGKHENLWEKPGHYVNIINHYARLLA